MLWSPRFRLQSSEKEAAERDTREVLRAGTHATPPASRSKSSGCKPRTDSTSDKHRYESKKRCLHRRSSKTPKGLKNDSDDDRLDSIENVRYRRELAKTDVEPSETGDHQCCRKNETATCDQQTSPTGAQVANVNSHFARTGSRYQIACANQVEEFFTREPLSPADELVFHDSDVRCRSSEGCRAQPQKEQSELTERNLSLFGNGIWRLKGWLFSHELRPVFLPTMRREITRQHQPAAERRDRATCSHQCGPHAAFPKIRSSRT